MRSILAVHDELGLHVGLQKHLALGLLDSEIPYAIDVEHQDDILLLAVIGNEPCALWLRNILLFLALCSFYFLDHYVVETRGGQLNFTIENVLLGNICFNGVALDQTNNNRSQTYLMQENLELLLVFLGLVVHWQWNLNHRAVQLDVFGFKIWSSPRTEHTGHLKSKVSLFESWLVLERSVELHSWYEFVVSSRVHNHRVDLGHQLVLKSINHALLKIVSKFADKDSLEGLGRGCLEVTVDRDTSVLLRNDKLKVSNLKSEDIPAIIEFLFGDFNSYVERNILALDIDGALHGDVARPIPKLIRLECHVNVSDPELK